MARKHSLLLMIIRIISFRAGGVQLCSLLLEPGRVLLAVWGLIPAAELLWLGLWALAGTGLRVGGGVKPPRKPGVQTRSSSFLQNEQFHVLKMTVFNHYRVECKRSSVLR